MNGQIFTRGLLIEAADLGEVWDYNRQLDPVRVRLLPDTEYPISRTVIHWHRAGTPCEPHVRCVFSVPGRHDGRPVPAVVDVPVWFFDRLPPRIAGGPATDGGPV